MSDEKSFKSRVSDVFGCLDKVDFKSDSSLKQDKPKDQPESDGFRRPRSPVRSRGGGGGTREPSRSFDRFKKTESIFQEAQDVGSWKQRDNQARPQPRHRSSSNTMGGGNRHAKNPMYDNRRPQRKDPSKYTKYSLADVEDVTDRSNTMAALDFINSRKRSSEAASNDGDSAAEGGGPSSSSSRPVFKKPKRAADPESGAPDTKDNKDSNNFGLSCGNSKRVMPEAVVGRQQAAAKKKREPAAPSNDDNPSTDQKQKTKKPKQKKLSHLDFEEEEDD